MKQKTKYILLFIGLIFLDLFYSYMIVAGFKKFGIDIKNFSEPYKSISLILIELSLMIIVYFIFRKELKQEFTLYKNNFKNFFFTGLILWLIGVVLMIVSNIIITFICPTQALNEEAVQEVLKKAPIYASFAACIFAPFMEEVIFRKTVKKIVNNNILYILICGLIFGMVHSLDAIINPSLQLLYIIPYGLFGCVFAYTYVKTKSIFVPMTFHFIHNTILVIISLITTGVL